MPNGQRRLDDDGGIRQEWGSDTSNGGQPSGDTTLEIEFTHDDPNGEYGTHVLGDGDFDKRLTRENKTAIMIEGLSRERIDFIRQKLGEKVDKANPATKKGSTRSRVLRALDDDNLRWTKWAA
jgi:hypothetical protein